MRHHLHYKCLLDPGLPRAGYASCGLSVANQTFWKNKNAVIIWWGCKGHWNFGLHRMEVISAQDARLNFKWYWRKYMWHDWLTKIEKSFSAFQFVFITQSKTTKKSMGESGLTSLTPVLTWNGSVVDPSLIAKPSMLLYRHRFLSLLVLGNAAGFSTTLLDQTNHSLGRV